MGWASYMEDMIKRFEYTSNRFETSLAGQQNDDAPDYAKMRSELHTLRRDVEVCLQAFQKQLELVTDPTFDAYQAWLASEEISKALKIQNDALQAKVQQQEATFNKQLAETELHLRVKIGTLEAKLKNERREAEHSARSAQLRK